MKQCSVCNWPLETEGDRRAARTCKIQNCPGQLAYTESQLSADPSRGILNERRKTHGSFKESAIISQQIKHVFHSYGQYPTENPIYCEALDMIALKLSRILSGQANYKDHWTDIAGYAKLAEEACK